MNIIEYLAPWIIGLAILMMVVMVNMNEINGMLNNNLSFSNYQIIKLSSSTFVFVIFVAILAIKELREGASSMMKKLSEYILNLIEKMLK